MRQIELTSKLVLALIGVILVTAIVTLPYQNQVANAAPPTNKYQVRVTLTDVPADAADVLEVNVTIIRLPFFIGVSETQVKTVSSPSDGDTVRFSFTVPAGRDENNILVCGNTVDLSLSDCNVHPIPTTGSGPIRVDFAYPLPR